MSDFADRLIAWQRACGRHDLPWQTSRDPYRVWLSEIMLQQTQVDTVVPYYARFLQRFPTLASLAAAEVEAVLGLWSGLGYYARARNLHACARQIVEAHGGEFPTSPEAIARLPGIGRSTAAAIASFCFGARAAILDGNVKRVLCRHFAVEGFPGTARVEAQLWALAESLLPPDGVDVYIQAQMDLGATLCTRARPACADCPLQQSCQALRQGRTGELPAPRPRKARPERHQTVAVIRHGGQVLLEQRPPVGLWGGLLAFPDGAPEGLPLSVWLRRRFGLDLISSQALPPLRHAFTHFTLELLPQLAEVGPDAAAAREDGSRWVDLAALDLLPLPAPVRRILERLPVLRPPAAAGAASDMSG